MGGARYVLPGQEEEWEELDVEWEELYVEWEELYMVWEELYMYSPVRKKSGRS